MKSGRTKEAVPFLQKAIELRKDLHVAHHDLAIIYADAKQNDRSRYSAARC
jgi:Tfp pilus assembly protein PilF